MGERRGWRLDLVVWVCTFVAVAVVVAVVGHVRDLCHSQRNPEQSWTGTVLLADLHDHPPFAACVGSNLLHLEHARRPRQHHPLPLLCPRRSLHRRPLLRRGRHRPPRPCHRCLSLPPRIVTMPMSPRKIQSRCEHRAAPFPCPCDPGPSAPRHCHHLASACESEIEQPMNQAVSRRHRAPSAR